MKRNSFRLAVSAAILMFGCLTASGQSQPAVPKPNDAKPPQTPAANSATPEKSPESSAAAVDPNKYLIGPEDILFVRVWREPDFTLAAAVRPDGKITMPLIGDVQAGEQTPMQLTKTITELLGKYINNPDVNVMVQDVRSKKYYIDGEVNKPGTYLLVTPTTVLEALSNAGGFRDFANTKKIRILRQGNILHFNYKDVSRGKNLEQNIKVESGDHIIVP
ncbi:MAG TPA: polysaccharide biosynthesis/export family protein [Bryobacteraceae bacterium]|nr:polysaccharide biosynthesis/export family protein [Bryobacteraceae bacterium]